MSVDRGTPVEWAAWLVAIIGLWFAVSPYFYTMQTAARNNSIVAGLLVLLLGAYVGYTIRTS